MVGERVTQSGGPHRQSRDRHALEPLEECSLALVEPGQLDAGAAGRRQLGADGILIGGQRGRRVFLWLHLYEPHDPYEPPEPYASRYAGRPYDGEVAWTDELFGRFEDALGSLGMRDATALVVTSDHGEGLGEHDESLHGYIQRATDISPDHPVLVDRFLDDAVEIAVAALFDGIELYLGGVMEHIEEAGMHSGDSSCALPPTTIGRDELEVVRQSTEAIARGVGVRGLLNVQYALAGDVLYVLEANPRASRTVPFVSKATAVPLAKAAARIMLGATIADLRREGLLPSAGDFLDLPADAPIAVKEAVMPFNRFRTPDGRSVDTVLGPEMRSTGEVMGIDDVFGTAFAKSQTAAYGALPQSGRVFVSLANRDKPGNKK